MKVADAFCKAHDNLRPGLDVKKKRDEAFGFDKLERLEHKDLGVIVAVKGATTLVALSFGRLVATHAGFHMYSAREDAQKKPTLSSC